MDFLFGVNFAVALSMCLGFLLRERKLNYADQLMFLCFILTAFQFLLLGLSNNFEGLPLWLQIYAGGSGFFLVQALLLAYIIELIRGPRWGAIIASVPFFIYYVSLLHSSLESPEKYQFIHGFMLLSATSIWEIWSGSVVLIFALSFPVMGIYLISRYQIQIRQHYSDVTDLELTWLKQLLQGSLIVLVVGAIIVAPLLEYLSLTITTSLQLLLILISGFILFLGIQSLRQRQTSHKLEDHSLSQSSYLNLDELEEAKTQLLEFIEAEAPYTQQRLTLEQFAASIEWPAFKVSEVLNRGLNQHFHEFINRYRVAKVKRLIASADRDRPINLLELALAAGFNSKTAFNTVFKRLEGTTPSAYRKKLMHDHRL